MTKINSVNLEFSCPEKLYPKTSGEFFCHKCSHELVDFTKKSLEELQNEINNSVKPVCGAFKKSQLSDHFVKYALSTIIVTSSLSMTSCSKETIKPDSLLNSSENIEPIEEDSPFFGMIIESLPEPIGGYEKFLKDLKAEIRFPLGLSQKGKTFIEFSIDETGQMSDIKVVRGFNENADNEAVRALTALNYPFKPGRQRNKPVKSRMVIPILFD